MRNLERESGLRERSKRIRSALRVFCLACSSAIATSTFSTANAASPTGVYEAPIASAYVAPKSEALIIRDATAIDGKGQRIEHADIAVRDGKIIAIGPNLPVTGAREIDGKGRWITPGIIDVHSHNGTYVLPLTDIDRTASDVAEGSDINVADTWVETAVNPQDTAFSRALRAGVTTLQILPGSSPIFGGHSVVVKPVPAVTLAEMKFPDAPVGFKMACGENPKSAGAADEYEDWPTSRQGVFSYMRDAFAKAQAYLDQTKAGAVPERDAKSAALAGILSGNTRLHFHCYRASDMAAMLSLAKEFNFKITAFHHATEAYKISDLLRQAGTCSAVWSDWWGYKTEAMDAVRANAPMLEHAGACVMMHSDSAAVGQRLNLEAAKAEGAGRRLGLHYPPESMIRWITSVPASALGLDDRIGALAPGFNADIVMWSGNPFSIYSRPELVLIDGAVRFDGAHWTEQPLPDFELGHREYEAVQ